MRHKHADLLIAYANDSSLKLEWQHPDGEWFDVTSNPTFHPKVNYRIKPEPKRAFVYMVKSSNSRQYYPQSYPHLDDAEAHHTTAIKFGYTVTDIKEVEFV
jgi:hypothetical protein